MTLPNRVFCRRNAWHSGDQLFAEKEASAPLELLHRKRKDSMMGRKAIVMLLVSLSLAAIAASAQAEGSRRSEVKPYDFGAGIHHDQTSTTWTLAVPTWATFETQPGDRMVRIVLEDLTGATSLVHVHVDRDNDGKLEVERNFCSSEVELKVTGDTTIEVFPLTGTCEDGTPSLVTQGKITATFFRY